MFESEGLKVHEGRYYGLYRGFVYDNKDPQNQGRLKLQVPSVYGVDEDTGDPTVSDWAYPMFPISGIGWGMNLIPPVKNPDGSNVMVWVAFEQGDKDCPVWMGCPLQSDGLQSSAASNSKDREAGVTKDVAFTFTTPGGLQIILNDQLPEKAITIKSNALQIIMNDKTKKILVTGDVNITGDVKVTKDVKSNTDGSAVSLTNHTHTGVHGETSKPH